MRPRDPDRRSTRLGAAAALALVAVPAALVLAAPALAQEPYDPEARLAELGLELPPADEPVANYVKAVRAGDLVFLSGHGPCFGAGWSEATQGKVGRDRTIEEGYEAARLTGLCMLATLRAELGDLDRVRRIVKVLGMVNSTADFIEHPKVVNGFSDLMVEVFGDRGRHARSAVGMGSLPFDSTVEIEMIVEAEAD